jgi:hypothetical protein
LFIWFLGFSIPAFEINIFYLIFLKSWFYYRTFTSGCSYLLLRNGFFSVTALTLSNINRIEKLLYFTWRDFPILRSNIWKTHSSLQFHFFHSLLPQRMCEMYFAKFHMKNVTSFIHKTFISIIFEIHMPTTASQCFRSQYVTRIFCSEFQGNFLKAQTYSLKHTTIGSTRLDYRSAQLKYLCLTPHNTHDRQISMSLAGIQTTIPPTQRPQSQFLDRAASGIDNFMVISVKILSFEKLHTHCSVVILL